MTTPIKQITIEFIDHKLQRYPSAGDWYIEDDTLVIKVSRTEDPNHERLVAVHELVEALLCDDRNISAEQVDAFDMGAGADLDDPGLSRHAPYHREHMTADVVERLLAVSMNVDWQSYEAALDGLE